MPLLSRRQLLLAEIEITYGTDPTPTSAANAILVRNIEVTPLEADTVSRELIRPYLGQSEQLLAQTRVLVNFEVELAGSGTAGTAPAYGPLLKACAMTETISAGVSVTYEPNSDTSPGSVTIYFNNDGVLHKATGCRGTFSLNCAVDEIPTVAFEFTGIYNSPTDVSISAPTYANQADPGGLSFLLTHTPSLSLGQVGMSSEVPPQVAAFVAARQLAYARPGLYLRHFIQTGTAMKAWLFAAIKLTSPQFPVAPDLEGAVSEALAALKQHLASDAKDHLTSVVSKLIQSGTSLDLKRWVAAVDLTADRAGFVVAHDLETAVSIVQASEEGALGVGNQERHKQLVLYASSAAYFQMRRSLAITVEA